MDIELAKEEITEWAKGQDADVTDKGIVQAVDTLSDIMAKGRLTIEDGELNYSLKSPVAGLTKVALREATFNEYSILTSEKGDELKGLGKAAARLMGIDYSVVKNFKKADAKFIMAAMAVLLA